MTAPTPNAELAYRVLDHIDAHPETWQQSTWHCGSSFCFGGWAVALAGGVVNDDDEVCSGPSGLIGLEIEEAAWVALGIDEEQAWIGGTSRWLFGPDNTREELAVLVAEIFGPRPDGGEGGSLTGGES